MESTNSGAPTSLSPAESRFAFQEVPPLIKMAAETYRTPGQKAAMQQKTHPIPFAPMGNRLYRAKAICPPMMVMSAWISRMAMGSQVKISVSNTVKSAR